MLLNSSDRMATGVSKPQSSNYERQAENEIFKRNQENENVKQNGHKI